MLIKYARSLGAVLGTATLLGITATASAASPAQLPVLSVTYPFVVRPADTFTFAIAGFNSTSGTGYILGSGLTATFGTTQTFTAAGYNGQDYTITSSETVGATTTTDTFTVSTPTNFLTTTTVNGTTITALQFDLGDANSGVGVASGANTVDLVLPITSASATGNIIYGSSNSNFNLSPTVTLSNANGSFAAVEGVNTGTTAISTLAIHSFTLNVTYPNAVPEPSTLALGALALAGCATVVLRRRRD